MPVIERQEDVRMDAPTPHAAGRRPRLAPVVAVLVLTMSGTAGALKGTNTVDSGDIKNGQVKSGDIQDGGVTSKDIKDGDVKSVDIGSGAVQSSDLADGSVNSAKTPRKQSSWPAGTTSTIEDRRIGFQST